ncbi:glycoside hydrolase, partial [Gorgonomyces haynaldii]
QQPRRRRASHDPSFKERRFLIDVEKTLAQILMQEDTDGNFQITIQDAGPKSFQLPTLDSGGFNSFEVRGTYQISNLLQELALASDLGRTHIILTESRLTENPVDRIQRLIKYHFWDALTRRIDASGLEKICHDSKNRQDDQKNRIYIPFGDKLALDYFERTSLERPHLGLEVVRLPEDITPEYVKSLNHHPGILSLGLRLVKSDDEVKIKGTPFIVPGGRFNEMYGWDSYFEALGLLEDSRVELARGMVENFCYEIEHYGKILNANRSYYLCRSQPPFLTDMFIQTRKQLLKKQEWTQERVKEWTTNVLFACLKELLSVWLNNLRLDRTTGLSKYHPDGIGVPPETESSHFDHILQPYADKHHLPIEQFVERYNDQKIHEPELDEYFMHDRAVRESGHDTTYRFEGKCAHLATVDLNTLVYKYEEDLANLKGLVSYHLVDSQRFVICLSSQLLKSLANVTKDAINEYLWSPEEQLYFDWDCKLQKRTDYESATALWPLWAKIPSEARAALLVPRCLEAFEVAGGLVSGTEKSRGIIGLDRPNRQWDYPFGWAPHQILAWKGLEYYGFKSAQDRLTYKWLYLIIKAFVDFNGVVPEKFDVVNMTHQFNVEYGNVGSDFKCVVKEGFGWMNASIQIGIASLPVHLKRALGTLTDPHQLFTSL